MPKTKLKHYYISSGSLFLVISLFFTHLLASEMQPVSIRPLFHPALPISVQNTFSHQAQKLFIELKRFFQNQPEFEEEKDMITRLATTIQNDLQAKSLGITRPETPFAVTIYPLNKIKTRTIFNAIEEIKEIVQKVTTTDSKEKEPSFICKKCGRPFLGIGKLILHEISCNLPTKTILGKRQRQSIENLSTINLSAKRRKHNTTNPFLSL